MIEELLKIEIRDFEWFFGNAVFKIIYTSQMRICY